MKVEKITENKIRVVLNRSELTTSSLNSIVSNISDNKSIFLSVLKKAEIECNFITTNCKLLVESLSFLDDFLIFTITRYSNQTKNDSTKKLIAKRKDFYDNLKESIYIFNTYSNFENFSKLITNLKTFCISDYSDNMQLYFYKNFYFLIITNITNKLRLFNIFHSKITEFAEIQHYNELFHSKLIEHGNLIFESQAIYNASKF